MKRLLHLAFLATFALTSTAAPLFASGAFGLCYDRNCKSKCGSVCRQPNAFTPSCTGNGCAFGINAWGGYAWGCCGCGWGGSGCDNDCGGRDNGCGGRNCWKCGLLCHLFEHCHNKKCGPGCAPGGPVAGCVGQGAVVDGGVVDGGIIQNGLVDGGTAKFLEAPPRAPISAPPSPLPTGPKLAEPPVAAPKPEGLPAPKGLSGYYPYAAPQAGMMNYPVVQPVSYQTGYQNYPAYPAYAPGWGYYPAAAYYPSANFPAPGYYTPQPYYPPGYAPNYWYPMGR